VVQGVTPALRLRPPQPDEAEAITALMLRAKRHWGYPDAFMAAVGPSMAVTTADLVHPTDHLEVLEVDGGILGFVRLRRYTELAFLEDLWIDPGAVGKGYGRLLFERAVAIARGWGKGVIELHADPHAEPFYEHLGAVRVGMIPSEAVPGRSLPVMRYTVEPGGR
jgi:GNAT superfamily N-acetyltransferase